MSCEMRALSIENQVSAITNIITFMIKIQNKIINKGPNYLMKGYMRCQTPPSRADNMG